MRRIRALIAAGLLLLAAPAHAAIAALGGTATGANNPTSGNFPFPGGYSATTGDVCLFWWYARGSTKTWTDTSGGKLTVLYEDSGGTFGPTTIAVRVMQTGDLATDFTWTSGNVNNADVIYGTACFSGVDGTTPIEADSGAPSTHTYTNVQSPNPPAATVATSGATVVTIFGKNNDYAGSITAPSTYTLLGSAESTGGTDASGGLAYRLGLSAGSEDPGAWTLGGAGTDDGTLITLVLKPAAGGGGGGCAPTLTLVGVGC